jgi:hypothetical protein
MTTLASVLIASNTKVQLLKCSFPCLVKEAGSNLAVRDVLHN